MEKKDADAVCIKVILSKNAAPDKPIRATLLKGAREISSFLINDAPALFENVPYGNYIMVFTQNGKKAGEYPIEIRETHFEKK